MSIIDQFTTPRGSLSSSIGDSAELEANLTLSDKLKVFKSSSFDPNAYVASKSRSMNEKVSFFMSLTYINFDFGYELSSMSQIDKRFFFLSITLWLSGNRP